MQGTELKITRECASVDTEQAVYCILTGVMGVFTTFAALLVATSGTTTALCPSQCICISENTTFFCEAQGLQKPPQGFWPNVTSLYLKRNNISILQADTFDGFPDLQLISLDENPIEVLNLDFLTTLKKLSRFFCRSCSVANVIPLANGLEVANLRVLSLEDNKLITVNKNMLSGLTNENLELDLSGNPLVLPIDRPLLVSSNLITLKLHEINAGNLSKETFTALPNLRNLHMINSGVTDLSDALTALPSLNLITLDSNPLKIIKEGFLSKEQTHFRRLDLEFAAVEVIEVEAVDVMQEGVIYLTSTPLACGCTYEDLYWWGKEKGIRIMAECVSRPPCEFSRK